MKKCKMIVFMLITVLLLTFSLFAGVSANAEAASYTNTSEAAISSQKVVSSEVQCSSAASAAQTSNLSKKNTASVLAAGKLGFLIVLLSTVLSGTSVFLYIRHSKQGTLPIALGSARSRAAGVIMR